MEEDLVGGEMGGQRPFGGRPAVLDVLETGTEQLLQLLEAAPSRHKVHRPAQRRRTRRGRRRLQFVLLPTDQNVNCYGLVKPSKT